MTWRDKDEIARREHADRQHEAKQGPGWNDDKIHPARREHAWRLRIEGLTYDEIGRRLTVTRERARQLKITRKHQSSPESEGVSG